MTTLTLSGCEFSVPQGSAYTVSGNVTFEGSALSGVKIQTDFNVYATSAEDGSFSFETRTTKLKIHAKKDGYNFEPKSIDVTQNSLPISFEATLATKLNGALALSQILIAPTSISSLPDNNFVYNQNSKENLKLSSFELILNEQVVLINTQTYLQKDAFTNIYNQSQPLQIDIADGITSYEFNFKLKTFFTYNFGQNESVLTEPFKNLSSYSVLDTGDLNEDGQIKFIANGINSIQDTFTYNIQLVFEYQI